MIITQASAHSTTADICQTFKKLDRVFLSEIRAGMSDRGKMAKDS